jgi:two-component system NtrC family sensor kinase
MKKIILFCLIFSSYQLFAQNINVDSLIHVAISHTNATAVSSNQNHDSLFRAFTLAKAGSQRISVIYKLINNGQPTSRFGLTYHYKILDWARKNDDPISEAIIMSEIAFQLAGNGDIAEAVKMDLDALKLAEKTGDNEAIGIVYDSLGCCYGGSDNGFAVNDKLMSYYFKQGLKFSALAHNDLFVSYDFGGMGAAYRVLNKLDSAEFFGLKSFEYAVRKNVTVQIARSLLDIAQLQTNDKLKLKYLRASIAIATKGQDNNGLGNVFSTLGKFFKTHNRTDSAMFYAKKAYWLSIGQSVFGQIQPAQLLMQLYTGANVDSALKYTNIYYTARDSVFNIAKSQRVQAITYSDQQRKQELETEKTAYAARLRVYLLVVIIAFLIFTAFIFWRNNNRNKKGKIEIQNTLDQLKSTQTQLIQSEKMASLGELTAGIAHEIQNPLNFVNNFSEVNKEILLELEAEIKYGNTEDALALTTDLIQNEEKISHHGKRADSIVKGMLQHSQAGSGSKEPTNINALADEYMRLAYHGLRAKDKSFNAEMVTHFDPKLPKVNAIPQDIGRVLLNLFNNAFYAVNQKQKTTGVDYKPEVLVSTSAENGHVIIKVKDNGIGIPDAIKEKIMQPFFTTKPTGEGTGLGLSLTYDMVVKGHGGSIDVNTKEGEYAEFKIKLPFTS